MADSGLGRKQRVSLVANQDRGLVAKRIRAEWPSAASRKRSSAMSAYDERTIRNVLKGLPVKDSTLYEICASLQIDLSKLPLSEPFGLADRKPNDMEKASVAVLAFQKS